jgi:pyrophosphatase PpaX
MSRPLNTYLFDLDGTLIDSVDLIMQSFRHTMVTHRGEAPPEEVWLRGLGTPLWNQLKEFSSDQDEINRMVATYREFNHANHDTMVKPYAGLLDVIQRLKAGGKTLGVVTSKMRAGTVRGLTCCDMEDLFDDIVGADDTDKHKPDPTPVLVAMERLRADPATTIFIGDSPHDLASGRAAGVRTGAALWGPFPKDWLEKFEPDYWLERPGEILEIK